MNAEPASLVRAHLVSGCCRLGPRGLPPALGPALTLFLPRRRAIALIAAPLLAGCRFPADPEETLAEVQGGELKVGLLVPLATFGEMAEQEALLAAAERIGAEPVLIEGRAHDLVASVENGTIHLLAGGLPKDTPLSSQIALTKPWGQAAIAGEVQDAVWGLRKGENAFLLALNRAVSGDANALS